MPVKLTTHPDAILAGAIGAALWGAARFRVLARRAATHGDRESELGRG